MREKKIKREYKYKHKCKACGKKLRKIKEDWNTRQYHKKCYNDLLYEYLLSPHQDWT